MSMTLMVKVMAIKVGNPLRKLILIKLADNASDTGECWPSHQHVADQCEVSKSTVRKHIKDLCESGFLRIEHRKGPKGNSSNLYYLTLDSGALESIPLMPSESTGMPSESISPMPSESTRTSHSIEPVTEPKDLPTEDPKPEDLITKAFDKFWKGAITRKKPIPVKGLPNQNKPAAFRAFKSALKRHKSNHNILALVEDNESFAYAFSKLLIKDVANRVAVNQFGFDKLHPERYIKNDRWNDDIAIQTDNPNNRDINQVGTNFNAPNNWNEV